MKALLKVGFLFFFAIFMITFGSQESILAKGEIKTFLYGKSIQGEQKPVIKNNSVLVPFRSYFNTLGLIKEANLYLAVRLASLTIGSAPRTQYEGVH